MDIRIKSLTLQNFKGVKNAEIVFEGSNMLVEGENGTGKSTIFDAFTWLLFGKDHAGRDQTQFDIKTIDPQTKQPIARLDHSVSAVLVVDGCEKTLQRIWRENWVKPKGEAEAVLKGHLSVFLVDGVDVGTKAAYDSVIHQWIDEDVFKMITNPLFFIDDEYTPWKVRRETLLGLVAGQVDRSEIMVQFSDLLKEMNGESMDMFKKRIAGLKKENKKLLAECEPKIKAYLEAMPAKVNEAAVREQIAACERELQEKQNELKARLDEIDRGIADINVANAERSKKANEIYARISELQLRQADVLSEGLKDAQGKVIERNSAIMEAKAKLNQADADKFDTKVFLKRAKQDLIDSQVYRADMAGKLKDLGVKYNEAKGRVFDFQPTTRCHACGQELPAETVEQAVEMAKANFIQAQRVDMSLIMEDAQKLKEEICRTDGEIRFREEKVRALEGKLAQTEEAFKAAEKVWSDISSTPEVDMKGAEDEVKKLPAFRAIADEIQHLKVEALDLTGKAVSAADLVISRRAVEAEASVLVAEHNEKVKPFHYQLSLIPERARIEKLVADEEKREKALAEEVARLERLEYSAASFVKADIDAQEGAINRLFSVARWKMFDTTLDGGIVETCEVTTQDGVPFRSMNDARKIQCGMDVIRVLGERYGAYAPIFIDNAESITQTRFETSAQVIRLCVKQGEKQIRLTSE